jgi:peptidoglycan/LPS O-acetylase OafA/YrhL
LRNASYVRFATRRLFRIFPALWVAVALTFAAEKLTAAGLPSDQFHDWFRNVFLNGPSWADLGRNLVLAKANIDPVIWTLIPEVLCSLALPALIYLHVNTNWIGRLSILGLLASLGHQAGDASLQFMASFYAGFQVPREIARILEGRRAISFLVAPMGWLTVCIGNAYGIPYTPAMREICTVGAVLVIGGIVASPHSLTWLTSRPLRLLGRVSFSFYLLHLPSLYILVIAATNWSAIRPQTHDQAFLFAVVSIAIAISAAALCFRYIEMPGIAAGRKVSAALSRPRAGAEIAPSLNTPVKGGKFACT